MGKRNWIKVRNGLLDQKHVSALGFCPLYLYLYMLNNVDWDTGMIPGWSDGVVAQELGVKVWQVKEYRWRLRDTGYIKCQRILHGQDISINNWQTPFGEHTTIYSEGSSANHSEAPSPIHSEETPIGACMPSSSETLRLKDTGAENAQENEVDKPKKIGDVLDGMIKYAEPKIGVGYPEDVVLILQELHRLWGLKPPERSSSQYSFWLKGARELKLACAEIGIEVLQQLHHDWKESKSQFSVATPTSLVSMAYATAGKMRQRGETKAERPCIDCTGTGKSMVKTNRKHPNGLPVWDTVTCQRCGGTGKMG